jgi:phosphoserine phosphatase RsbU/P
MYPTPASAAVRAWPDDDSAPDPATPPDIERAPTELAGADFGLQRSWLTRGALVSTPRVQVASHCCPVHRCGGDLCAVYPLGEAILVVIGDVAGHDYDAALVCALAKGACDVAVKELRPLGPARLLELLGHVVSGSSGGHATMSCAVALIASRTMTVASAGHPLPYVVRDHGGRIEGVRCFGSLLGTGEVSEYQTRTVPLRPGDRVLWYTDGVLDTENESGARFGHRHVRAVLRRSGDAGATELVAALAAELFWFRGDAAPCDDATFAVAAIR